MKEKGKGQARKVALGKCQIKKPAGMRVLINGKRVWINLVWRDNALTGLVICRAIPDFDIFAITDTTLEMNDWHMRSPIVDSGSVVSACPKILASEVQMVDPEQRLNLLSVLGESLRHHGTRRNVKFQAAECSEMKVNLMVTDAPRPILSVKKGADCRAMTVFQVYGGGRIIQDKEAVQTMTMTLDSTHGFDIVHKNGACLFDMPNSQRSREQYK